MACRHFIPQNIAPKQNLGPKVGTPRHRRQSNGHRSHRGRRQQHGLVPRYQACEVLNPLLPGEVQPVQGGAPYLAKLVYNSNFTRTYG